MGRGTLRGHNKALEQSRLSTAWPADDEDVRRRAGEAPQHLRGIAGFADIQLTGVLVGFHEFGCDRHRLGDFGTWNNRRVHTLQGRQMAGYVDYRLYESLVGDDADLAVGKRRYPRGGLILNQ